MWGFAVMAVCFIAFGAVTALRECHMFQLNSYKRRVHVAWLRRTWLAEWLPRHILIAIAALLAAVGSWEFLVILFTMMQIPLNRPRKAKKPLVLTPRVKRLLATDGMLHFFALVAAWHLVPHSSLVLALAMLASPFFLLAADIVNAPLEKAINRHYLGDARRILAANPNLTVIGVTGSYGKTSVKHFLHRILESKYTVLMTPGNFNTTLGVVRAVREELRPIHEIFICEMGARNVGDIKDICDLVKPRYGILTSIGPQHLESFKSLANIIAAKFELVDSLPPDGVAFLNYDSEDIRHHDVAGAKVTYRLEPGEGDYVARDIAVSALGSSFTVRLADGTDARFETRLIGAHNVLNVTAAIAVADRLGVPPADMAVAVRRLESVPHRLQLVNRGDMTIIDDAYNANASGAAAALDVLAMFDGYRILVTPGMVELGAMQDTLNRELGVHAARVCDLAVLVGERQTRSIRDGLESAGLGGEKIHVVDTIEQAFARVNAANSGGRRKIVLLENDLPDNY